jgi:hypothetical protein
LLGEARPQALLADFGNQRVYVAILEIRLEQAAIEVAVVADRRAEGDVKVEPKHSPDSMILLFLLAI